MVRSDFLCFDWLKQNILRADSLKFRRHTKMLPIEMATFFLGLATFFLGLATFFLGMATFFLGF